MAVFRSDYTIRSLAGGATSQQFTNVDFRGKADPALRISPLGSRLLVNWDTVISVDPIVITLGNKGNISHWPPAERNPALDTILNSIPGPVSMDISTSLEGTWFNLGIVSDPIVIYITSLADPVWGYVADAGPINISIGFKPVDILLELVKENWIKWSNIGSLDFTIGRDNVAGERPLDWNGWIYEIKKLENKVIVYGAGGVSILSPSSRQYGLKTISKIGLYSQRAVAGDDEVHFFIDRTGQMWKLTDSMELLDYSEYFSAMNNIVMSYDIENALIYICDGVCGYVYSVRNASLGQGSANITGMGPKNGVLYITSPASITVPMFEICTDIYDMGTRKFKTIRSVEVGTDLTEQMQASVDYRVSNKVAFSSLGWFPVTLEGVAHIGCFGSEFRFRLRAQTYEYFELDYLKINGLIHNYSYTEHTLHSINEQRMGYDS